MVEVKIKKINKFHFFTLVDENNNEYELQFQFYGMNEPSVDDVIIIHESLLDRKSPSFAQPYAFQIVDCFCENVNNAEFIAVKTFKNKYILKRVYG